MYGNENSAEGGFDVERTILLLGNPELYEVSREVKIEELHQMEQVREDLRIHCWHLGPAMEWEGLLRRLRLV